MIRDIVAAAPTDEKEAKRLIQDLLTSSEALRHVQKTLPRAEVVETSLAGVQAIARGRVTNSAIARMRSGSMRMLRQTGNAAVTAGSTRLVSRASATDVLSAAVESGAVSSKTDQGAATFTINALPIAQILNQDGPPYGCGNLRQNWQGDRQDGVGVCEQGYGRWLRGLSGTVSFNINSKETPAPLLTNSTGRLVADGIAVLKSDRTISALALKYEFFTRETSEKKLRDETGKAASNLNKILAESHLLGELSKAFTTLQNLPGFDPWKNRAETDLQAHWKSEPDLRRAFDRQMMELTGIAAMNADLAAKLIELTKATVEFENSIAAEAAERTFRRALTLDLVHQRPTDQPWIDKLRLDFNTPLGKKNDKNDKVNEAGAALSLDFNAAVTMFHATQSFDNKSKRLRDASASLALNWRLKPWGALVPTCRNKRSLP